MAQITSLNIGDELYFLESSEKQDFRNTCRVCLGTKQVTTNGVTYPCPCCQSEEIGISVRHYVIRKYHVYSVIETVTPTFITTEKYNLFKNNLHTYYKAFRKVAEHGTFDTKEILKSGITKKANCRPDISKLPLSAESVFFTDYNLAVTVCEELNAEEQRKLNEYNAEHNTSHQLVKWNLANDKVYY